MISYEKFMELRLQGLTVNKIAEELGIGKTMMFKLKKQWNEEGKVTDLIEELPRVSYEDFKRMRLIGMSVNRIAKELNVPRKVLWANKKQWSLEGKDTDFVRFEKDRKCSDARMKILELTSKAYDKNCYYCEHNNSTQRHNGCGKCSINFELSLLGRFLLKEYGDPQPVLNKYLELKHQGLSIKDITNEINKTFVRRLSR